jgi:hypothetical protein
MGPSLAVVAGKEVQARYWLRSVADMDECMRLECIGGYLKKHVVDVDSQILRNDKLGAWHRYRWHAR